MLGTIDDAQPLALIEAFSKADGPTSDVVG